MSKLKLKPIETVYINNINDKVSLKKVNEELLKVFNKYGEIIDIQLKKNLKMKGQAFITFDSLKSAKDAIKANNKTVLFGKPLKITYAKTLADIKTTEEDIEARKNLKKSKNDLEQQESNKKRKLEVESTQKAKKPKVSIDFTKLPPNKILLLQNLSKDTTQEILNSHFEHLSGFINIRLLKIRNLAFIEFDSEIESKNCLDTIELKDLQLKLGDDIQLTYAKK